MAGHSLAGDLHHRLAEIRLRFTGKVLKRDESLARSLAKRLYRTPDLAVTARITVVVPKPLINLQRRQTLLAGIFLQLVGKNLFDNRKKTTRLGLGTGLFHPVTERKRALGHLFGRAPVHRKLPRSLTKAHPINKNTATY